MNTCLGSARLLALALAEAGENLEGRHHLRRCPSCAAAYHKILREHDLIVRELERTAQTVMAAPQLKPISANYLPSWRSNVKSGRRSTILMGFAAACAGAMAAALMLMMAGLNPRMPVTDLHLLSTAGGQSTNPALTIAAHNGAVAATSSYAPWQSDGMIFTDSTDDIGYHEAMAGTSNYEDLFYCDPQDDGTFCSASAEQG